MIVPFVSSSVDVLIRFVSVMYCVVQEVIKCQNWSTKMDLVFF